MHCPWKVPKTWYGRSAAALGFSSVMLSFIAGSVKTYNLSMQKYEKYKKENPPKVTPQTKPKPVPEHLKPYYEQNYNRFQDDCYVGWHAESNGLLTATGISLTGSLFILGKFAGKYSRCSSNLCQQVVRSSFAGALYSLSMISSIYAIEKAHAKVCQFLIGRHYRLNPETPDRKLASEYRKMHERRFSWIDNLDRSIMRTWRSFVIPK
jgi:hypothetical protein